MPVWFVLMLLGTGALVVAKQVRAGVLSFAAGTYRICMPAGTDPGLLKINFDSVTDLGSDCYQVVSSRAFQTSVLPSGTTVSRVG